MLKGNDLTSNIDSGGWGGGEEALPGWPSLLNNDLKLCGLKLYRSNLAFVTCESF